MKLLHVLFLFLYANKCVANPIPAYFKNEIKEADSFIKLHQSEIMQNCEKYEVDAGILIAMVYPELLRYSYLQNLIETSALELLYVNAGSEVANFSIGTFQMKPSFIEDLELALISSGLDKKYPQLIQTNPKSKEARKNRLDQLKTFNGQLVYAIAFLEISQKLFPDIKPNDVRFWSTHYNCGLKSSKTDIMRWSNTCTFPFGLNQTNNPFSYAEISDWRYNTLNLK